MHREEFKPTQFEAVRNIVNLLDPVRMGTGHMNITIHPNTQMQFDYIKETLMEAGVTSGMVHSPNEFHANIRALGRLANDFVVFCISS